MGAFFYDSPPSVPQNFSATGNIGDHVSLHWTHPHSDIAWFYIWRKLSDQQSQYVVCDSVPGNVYSWTDPDVRVAGKIGNPRFLPSACYKVQAKDNSNQFSGKTSPRCKPYIPFRLAAEKLPSVYALHGNFPNPFNPTTTIRYDLPEQSHVTLVIYDIMGREVRTLLDNREEAEFKSVVWNGKDDTGSGVSTGIYIYALQVWSLESEQTYHKTEKMVLLR